MLRPGLPYTLVAAGLIVGTGVALERTASAAHSVADPAVLAGVLFGLGFLIFGSSRWIGAASIFIVGAVMIESGLGKEPSWLRAIVIGCLWFAALEMSWEAIERRQGASYSRAANTVRLQEVSLVIAVSLALGLVASASATFAPTRSVLLQAVVIGAVLAALVVAARGASAAR